MRSARGALERGSRSGGSAGLASARGYQGDWEHPHVEKRKKQDVKVGVCDENA